jgi:hypothetical protein
MTDNRAPEHDEQQGDTLLPYTAGRGHFTEPFRQRQGRGGQIATSADIGNGGTLVPDFDLLIPAKMVSQTSATSSVITTWSHNA